MSVLDSLLAVLGEEDPAGGTGLAFALSSLLINPSDIRPRAGDLTTAGSAKGSPIGRLYGRLAELGQSAGRPGKFAAIMALNGCLEAGGCTPAALEAFQRQWLGIVTTCLTARAAQGVPRALACSCYSHILRGVHAAGRDTHVGREVMASLTSSIPSLLRVIEEDWDGPSPRASLSAALECFITLLIYSPQSVRSFSPKLITKCLAGLECSIGDIGPQCRNVLALIALHLPDLPLSQSYCSQLVNSINLLLDLAIPPEARGGVTIDAVSGTDPVLALPPLRCNCEEVQARLTSLLSALSSLMSPPHASPGASVPAPIPALLHLYTNLCSLRPLHLAGGRHSGLVSTSSALPPSEYNSLLPPIKAAACKGMLTLLSATGTGMFRAKRDVTAAVLDALSYACPLNSGGVEGSRDVAVPAVASAALELLEKALLWLGVGSGSLLKAGLPFALSVVSSYFSDGAGKPPAGVVLCALRVLCAGLLGGGPLLSPDTRLGVDGVLLLAARAVDRPSARLPQQLAQEVHRAISVAIVTPTPSGATSHLLTYATGLYSANTTSILSLRLPGAVATALTHPMCAPLALPIHAVDDAARLAIAKACAAAVEATVEVNAVPMLAPQMAVSGASPAPPISASLAGLSSVATPVPTAPADSSSFSVLAADQPVVSAISEATAPVAAAQSEHVSAPATGLAGGFTGVSLSFPSFTVKGGPTVSKRQRDAAPDDDEDDMEFPALIAGDPEE